MDKKHPLTTSSLSVLNIPSNQRLLAAHITLSRVASACALLIGVIVLFGWIFHVPILTSFVPGATTMKANAALGFVLAGLALWLMQPEPASAGRRRIVYGCAGVLMLIGLLTFGEYLFNSNIGIDQLIARESEGVIGTPFRGRMAPTTALAFILLGSALLLLNARVSIFIAQLLALGAGLIALMASIGYLYTVNMLYGNGLYTEMAGHTAFTFLVLCLGIMFARPNRGVMELMTTNDVGGISARCLLPAALIVPIALGWLCLAGLRAGYYSTEFAVSLLTLSSSIVFAVVVWWNARVLSRIDVERRHMQDALQAREQTYRTLLEQASDGIFVTDAQGRCVTVNPRACEMLGYSEAELLQLTMADLVSPDELVRTPLRINDLRAGKPVISERYLRRKDGSTLAVEISAKMLADGRLHGILRDITERKRGEEAQTFLAAIVESSDDGIIGIRLDGTVVSWNTGATRLFGYAPEGIIGRSFSFVWLPARHDEFAALLARIGQGECITQYETRCVRSNGSEIDVSLTISPMRNSAGTIVGASTIIRDVTDRKRLQAQFLQAQKMESVGQLAGGIAHDFNNLLTAITGYTDLVLEELPVGSLAHEDLHAVKHAAQRAATLTRQLLAFARKQVIEPQVINLNELIEDMDKLLRRLIGADIVLTTLPDTTLGQIKVDPGQIEQVIVNMAINARDAMPNGGRLTIETANVILDDDYAQMHANVTPGNYVMLAISDSGSGMDAATKQHIFEPFFTTKEPGKGTGLGLATCYGIVKQHGGHIWLYSELGHGTTFKIYLPRVEDPAETLQQRDSPAPLPRGAETVLVVEDEPAVRALTSRILRTQGYTVLEAAHGVAAMEIVQTHQEPQIDLLLTDVVMPQMGGKALADYVTARYPTIKVMFISGYATNAIVYHGQIDPQVTFVQKPIAPAALARKVRETLDS